MSDERLDKKKYLQRVIIVSWIGLVICSVIKLFGANAFEIVCTNKTFIAVCNYADTHLWAKYVIGATYCFISLYFFILAILQRTQYKAWQVPIFIITVLVGTGIKIWNPKIGLIFDVWQFIVMPILFLGKQWKSYWKVALANVLLFVFQAVSMYAKNLNFGVLGDSVLVGAIYSIDVFLMLILYFAYANLINLKKENDNG